MGGNRYPRRLQVSRKTAMSNNDLTISNKSVIRAKSFKVISGAQNFAQYVRTVKAYALASMPLEHIANAGEEIGDAIERAEIDANLLESSKSKAGEIAEDENKIMAWQSRGETISIINQLPSAQPLKETEIVPVINKLVAIGETPEQKINVLEGIAVFNNQAQPVANQSNSQLENNPYLSAPANIK